MLLAARGAGASISYSNIAAKISNERFCGRCRRFVDGTTPAEVGFSPPAPPGAYLGFAGIGDNTELSVDGGATWRAAARQAQATVADEHFKSYWTPIPAGLDRVGVRGTNG